MATRQSLADRIAAFRNSPPPGEKKPRQKRNWKVNADGEESEEMLHRKAASLFSRIIAKPDTLSPDGVYWCSIENRPRNAIAGSMNQARGVTSNFPDMLFIYRGEIFVMEWKNKTGKVRDGQKVTHTSMSGAGARVGVPRSLEDGIGLLDTWAIPHRGVTL